MKDIAEAKYADFHMCKVPPGAARPVAHIGGQNIRDTRESTGSAGWVKQWAGPFPRPRSSLSTGRPYVTGAPRGPARADESVGLSHGAPEAGHPNEEREPPPRQCRRTCIGRSERIARRRAAHRVDLADEKYPPSASHCRGSPKRVKARSRRRRNTDNVRSYRLGPYDPAVAKRRI